MFAETFAETPNYKELSMNKATCLVCRSPARERIDGALRRGESIRALATRHGLSRSTVSTHRRRCLPACDAQAVQTAAERHREGALGRLEDRISEAKRIMREAKAKGNLAVWRQTNVDLAALEEKFEALSRVLVPKEESRRTLRVSFTTDDKVRVTVVPGVTTAAQAEVLEAGEDDSTRKLLGSKLANQDQRIAEAYDPEAEPGPEGQGEWSSF